MYWTGSNSGISAAIWVVSAEGSNRWMRRTPLLPATSASIIAGAVMPTAVTAPTPVTTTRISFMQTRASRRARVRRRPGVRRPEDALDPCRSPGRGLRPDLLLEVPDRCGDRRHLLGVLIGDLDVELLLEGHDELHGVERVGTEIVDERSLAGDLFGAHSELLLDDLLHAFSDVAGHVRGLTSSSRIHPLPTGVGAGGVQECIHMPPSQFTTCPVT